jgi:hypothetical protein
VTRYTVEHYPSGRVIRGESLPVSDLIAMLRAWGESGFGLICNDVPGAQLAAVEDEEGRAKLAVEMAEVNRV